MTHTNKYANRFQGDFLQWVLKRPLTGLLIHWFFQGMLYMDRTERMFKICIDLILTVAGGIILHLWVTWPAALLSAFLIAHTTNFLFNAQPWVLLKHYGFVNNSQTEFNLYAQQMAKRVMAEPSIALGAVYGSHVRAEWKPGSDLDVRLVREPGFRKGVHACFFVLHERTRATWHRFPLDLYLLDSQKPLSQMRSDETPQLIKGGL